MRAWLMVGALVGSACGGGGKDPAVCRREAAELGQLLSTMDHELPSFFVGKLTLVTRTDLPPIVHAYAPIIEITSDGANLDALDAPSYRTQPPRDPDLVYLVIDENAPWEHVARTLRRLHELKILRPALAFTRPPTPVTKPPRSRIDDDLDRIQNSDDAGNKATELARLIEKEVKGCPAIVRVFGSVAADTGESKAETIIRAIEPALVECNCNLDLPSFRSAMFRVLYVEKPQSSFRITLDPAATPITLPPSTPWRIAHDRFSPDARVWVNAP